MAADSDPPPPNPAVQRAAKYQSLVVGGVARLIERENAIADRILALSEQDDNLPVALGAAKYAFDVIRDHHAGLSGRVDEDRPLTPEEEREADEIAERLRAKKKP